MRVRTSLVEKKTKASPIEELVIRGERRSLLTKDGSTETLRVCSLVYTREGGVACVAIGIWSSIQFETNVAVACDSRQSVRKNERPRFIQNKNTANFAPTLHAVTERHGCATTTLRRNVFLQRQRQARAARILYQHPGASQFLSFSYICVHSLCSRISRLLYTFFLGLNTYHFRRRRERVYVRLCETLLRQSEPVCFSTRRE